MGNTEDRGRPETSVTWDELLQRVIDFRDARDWSQFHTVKNLAAAISIEAAELQQTLLWTKSVDEERAILEERRAEIEDEVADVVILCMNLCAAAAIDLPEAVMRKLRANETRYPVDKARGRAAKAEDL
jgi:NTP pyrophosphatase (non-canonical NTP hydrolase)